MGWLLGWLIFGLLAAYESGKLALNAGGEWSPLLALAYLLGSAACLAVIAWRAIVNRRASALLPLWFVSLLVLGASVWRIYGAADSGEWVSAAMFGAAYSALGLLALMAAMFIAWRRQRAHDARVAHAREERERQHRMEGIRTQGAALAAAAAAAAGNDADALGSDSDFVLPSRPKWEES